MATLSSSAYGNSSEEDDADPWASSRVSTKRTIMEEDMDISRPLKKPTNKLPGPNLAGNLPKDEVVDDPSLHGNRIRSFPHERGNWASFVYIPWKVNPAFSSAVECITNFFQSSGFNLEICEDFHISLSRTVVLRHHWIEGFTSSIRKQLNGIQRFPVQIFSQNIDVYTNEEKTRTFIAFKVEDQFGIIDLLRNRIDSCLTEYQLPTFYKESSYHVSIAWLNGDVKQELKKVLLNFPIEINVDPSLIDEIRCKIGNLLFNFSIS